MLGLGIWLVGLPIAMCLSIGALVRREHRVLAIVAATLAAIEALVTLLSLIAG